MSEHMYQITRHHNLEDPIFLLYVVFVKTSGDMFWNSRGNTRNISFFFSFLSFPFLSLSLSLSLFLRVKFTQIYKTTKMTFKYGSHTSNDEELLSSCSDLDTFDDLLGEVLNQNKESFSPKTKPRR